MRPTHSYQKQSGTSKPVPVSTLRPFRNGRPSSELLIAIPPPRAMKKGTKFSLKHWCFRTPPRHRIGGGTPQPYAYPGLRRCYFQIVVLARPELPRVGRNGLAQTRFNRYCCVATGRCRGATRRGAAFWHSGSKERPIERSTHDRAQTFYCFDLAGPLLLYPAFHHFTPLHS
jgi:hypothetical protein